MVIASACVVAWGTPVAGPGFGVAVPATGARIKHHPKVAAAELAHAGISGLFRAFPGTPDL